MALATFSGRKEKKAASLKKEMITELVSEVKLVRELESFVCKMITHYGTPGAESRTMSKPAAAKELLTARGLCLSWCGRYLIKVGEVLRAGVVAGPARRSGSAFVRSDCLASVSPVALVITSECCSNGFDGSSGRRRAWR